jgi:hypothetical protein
MDLCEFGASELVEMLEEEPGLDLNDDFVDDVYASLWTYDPIDPNRRLPFSSASDLSQEDVPNLYVNVFYDRHLLC